MSRVATTGLTRAQGEVLRTIADYLLARGWSPSVRELTSILNKTSYSTTFHHIQELRKKGMLEIPPAKGARMIRITQAGRDWLNEHPEPIGLVPTVIAVKEEEEVH